MARPPALRIGSATPSNPRRPSVGRATQRTRTYGLTVSQLPSPNQCKTVLLGGVRIDRVGWQFTFTLAAYNLIRLPKLLAASS